MGKLGKIKRFMIWLFWYVVYKFRPEPKTFMGQWNKLIRTLCYWQKFRPCVFRNEDFKMWDIFFSDEQSYVKTKKITCLVHYGQDSGEPVGVSFCDEELSK